MDGSLPGQRYTIKKAGEKGLGVFATDVIPRGTRILAEPPLLEVQSGNGEAKDILSAFEKLPVQQQDEYIQLHGFAFEDFRRAVERGLGQQWNDISEHRRQVLAVWPANSFGGTGVYKIASRINHSCAPNVHYSYNETINMQTFHAIRDIVAGEELTVTYINRFDKTRTQRQSELSKWGFVCECPACEQTESAQLREDKRVQLFGLDQTLAFWILLRSWKEALPVAQKLAAVQKSEGFTNRELSRSYYDAARCCYNLGDRRMALLWAEKELEIDRFCVGDDHQDVIHRVEVVERLRKAQRKPYPCDSELDKYFAP